MTALPDPQSQSVQPGADHVSAATRPLRGLEIGSVLAVALIALLVASFALWSAARSDDLMKGRIFQVISYGLSKSKQQIPYEQESVAIWDEAVTNTRNLSDPTWVDVNLGVWMYDYFKHDRVYIVDDTDHVSYAMQDGSKVSTASRSLPNATVEHLVSELRRLISQGALDAFEAGRARVPRVQDVSLIDGRPAFVSIMPLVPHTKGVSQPRGTENLITSIRFLDRSFVTDLGATYLLDGMRFSTTNDIASTEQSYPIAGNAGDIIGYFVWTPRLPGLTILFELLPVLAAGLFGIGGAIALLIARLRRTYTELATSEAQAMHLAFHDPLTGLPNRVFFNERLDAALDAVRNGQGRLALMFVDLDRFKQVNDTLGHAAGDALIREVAAELSAAIQAGDVVARMGGDEFAILMLDREGQPAVQAACDTIIERVSRPFNILGNQAVVGVSIGVALAPERGTERSDLARKADIALYQAKRDGGQRAQFFTGEMGEIAGQRHALELELRHALETGQQLEVVYQPLFTADSLTMSGVEALVRWTHPTLGAISPLVFVALAEECGLIDKLGAWVLSRACETAKAWDLDTIAVNVSAMQFRKPDFSDRVLRTLSETGLAPERLEIEITESTLLHEHGDASGCLKKLRARGVRVALDDFGTGYSSLSLLMNLDVDRIKIDRSFVHHLGQSAQSTSIVQAIVTMAHAVGVAVTAEGVETTDQKDLLVAIGCDHLQGFLLSKPLTALKLVELLPARAPAIDSSPNPASSCGNAAA